MYSFVFDGSTAKIILTSTSEAVISQPFKPVNAGSEPWIDEADARAWMEAAYPQFFIEIGEPAPPAEPIAETPNEQPTAEQSAGQGE